mmetsp:Transcript_8888/g.11462  ORF Transcript_8888/g.11462 Transcript_8888/m.11462 type:complete len:552 (+) Transcript_8888:112-1767(+)|eukprot:CAMPEP_0116058220 /NCGR_PEP_ID=MMETSP0322-20121206/5071_1 /TAXON_ID=163516 /ORGANISM="Leptocylindrus danicus var. apora, Strain B651" /LENGTH=551 /DNA_ID=CAMNT_0003542369 /DNA_START=71 /DNA_END=1726 /DNA_ORIENTATION=+
MLPEKVGEGKGVAAVVKLLALAVTSSIIFGIQTSDAFSPLSVRAKEKERRSAAISRLEASGRSSFNPFSLVNDMFDAVKPTESLPVNSKLNAALNSIPIPDWVEIRSSLERVQTEEERAFRKNLKYGIGRGSPLHKLRLFDESNKEDDVRIVFYRDSASWCPYCQKVWMSLEEKRIPYRIEKVNMRCYGDKPQSFLKVQPSGNIPVAIIDGQVYGQSNDILYALEEKFNKEGYKSLLPNDSAVRARASELLRLERQIFGAWMYWLTGNNPQRFREDFERTLSIVEDELQNSPGDFFLGDDVTTVDFQFAPFLERMAASLLFFKGFQMRVSPGIPTKYPAINRWFDAMETLESYQLTKSDYYTHNWDLPPQLGGCTYEEKGELFELAINGERSVDGTQGSWELPLQPHNGGIEPDWTWCGDEFTARKEAVERVSGNFEAIVKFASRGAGKKGMPPVSAALADPNAVSSEAVYCSLDVLLRAISVSMLRGNETIEKEMSEAIYLIQSAGEDFANAVVLSLSYLRDRVGVPRDMTLPAARQFRAHLNWAIGKLI